MFYVVIVKTVIPYCMKCRSKENATLTPSRSITEKLTASVKEKSLSLWDSRIPTARRSSLGVGRTMMVVLATTSLSTCNAGCRPRRDSTSAWSSASQRVVVTAERPSTAIRCAINLLALLFASDGSASASNAEVSTNT